MAKPIGKRFLRLGEPDSEDMIGKRKIAPFESNIKFEEEDIANFVHGVKSINANLMLLEKIIEEIKKFDIKKVGI